ncbi:MAG TPA: hypothetical protein VL460_00180 [Caulobacteraceae bacterium]|jgi:hypothetical protein|nr:hypothetical protein [Caulobacteraceae bacterium]
MLRLIMFLCAAGYIYSLGHNSAVASTEAAPPVSGIAAVAQAGAGWVAREVHEQTAWAADKAPAIQPADAVLAVAEVPAAAPAAPVVPVRRGLQVVFEPEITLASR